MGKKALGLDIGITSVGWSVVDLETSKVVDCGVRLFQEGNPEENLTRRTMRSARRMTRRRQHRLEEGHNLLESFNIHQGENHICPYEARVKGLSQQLSSEEFYAAYMHLLKRRGSSLESVETDDEAQEEKTKGILQSHDRSLLNGVYPCHIQLEAKQQGKNIRGVENNFRTTHYTAELTAILKNQDFNETQQEKLLSLLQRRRRFDEGPGSALSPTPYGRFILQDNGEVVEINLIEKMIGKCSVYADELRAPSLSPSAELFNFLNDCNNLKFAKDNTKLSKENKQDLIQNYIFKGKHNLTPKEMAKALQVHIDELGGFRIDKNQKPLLTPFKGFKSMIACLDSEAVDYWQILDMLDEVAVILTKTKVLEERVRVLTEKFSAKLSQDAIKKLSALKGFSNYHAFSLKIMRELRDDQIEEPMNHMQLLSQKGQLKTQIDMFKGLKEIPTDAENIYSPVARRATTQALKIVNRARQIYGEFDKIVIEMPRDHNSAEQRKRINYYQKLMTQRKKDVLEKAGKELNAKTRMKVALYMEQDCKCLYTGESIDLHTLINDPYAYEIDHILPISISFDDSFQNKVVVKKSANQVKGNRSPMQAFNEQKFSGWNQEQFYTYAFQLMKNKKISYKKFEYLVYDEDIHSLFTLKKFISRNLVDTSYSSRAVLNTLQSYFDANALDTKVLTIRGAVTSQFRKMIKLPKDREENYYHHAVDASIIAFMSNKKQFYNIMQQAKVQEGILKIQEDAEHADDVLEDTKVEYFSEDFIATLSSVKNLEHFKISHKVDRKANRKVSDDTIYSTRQTEDGEKVVKKYKDIYGDDGLKIAEAIAVGKGDKFLMYHHDYQTYEILEGIVKDYLIDNPKIGKENPFVSYREKYGAIRKYAKKGNGPLIVSMKYYDGNLGNHIDITDKNVKGDISPKQRRIVLLQISPYRTDFYQKQDGTYGFVTVRYKDVKYKDADKMFVIDSDWYDKQLLAKGLDKEGFIFSLNRGDIVKIDKKDKEVVTSDMVRFTATNNDLRNRIEVKPIYYYEPKQIMPIINKKIIGLTKYSTDVLGNLYKINKECLKLKF